MTRWSLSPSRMARCRCGVTPSSSAPTARRSGKTRGWCSAGAAPAGRSRSATGRTGSSDSPTRRVDSVGPGWLLALGAADRGGRVFDRRRDRRAERVERLLQVLASVVVADGVVDRLERPAELVADLANDLFHLVLRLFGRGPIVALAVVAGEPLAH